MRAVRSTLLVSVLFALASGPANATPFSGTWVPDASSTAEYCRDGTCAQYPVDASIGLGPSPGPDGALTFVAVTLGFRPLGLDSFKFVYGVVGQTSPTSGGLTIRGSVPDLESHDLTIRVISDRSLSLDGFLHVDNDPVGVFDVRFQDVRFVPVPEPASAMMVGLGLAALAARGRRTRVSSLPLWPSAGTQGPTRTR